MKKFAPYAKAIVGAVVAGLNSLYAALDNDILNKQEVVAIAIAVLTVGGGVYAVTNKPEAE